MSFGHCVGYGHASFSRVTTAKLPAKAFSFYAPKLSLDVPGRGLPSSPGAMKWAFLWPKSKNPGMEASGWVAMP